MKKLKRALLVGGFVAGICFVANGFSISSTKEVIPLGDTKFLSAKPVVGLTAEEAREILGAPHVKEKDSCALPVPVNGEIKPLVGEHWGYSNIGEEAKAEKHVCIVSGYVIAESSTIAALQNGVITILSSETAAVELARKLMDSSKDSSAKPPQPPFSTEREIEI